jgi:DNA topoisomerase-1
VEDDHPTPDTDSDDDKPIASRRKAVERKLKRIKEGGAKAADDGVDSEDEKPLSTRMADNAASKRSGGNVCDDDSDDDTTLAARFSRVTRGESAIVSSSKRKLILPGNKGLSHDASAPRSSVKRAGSRNSQISSVLKKAKLSDASALATVSVVREPEDDGDDNVPLARRLITIESSKSKSLAKKIVKESPSCFKKDEQKKENMKTEENSQSSETIEVCQGSGSRKKWSTLVHNGVLFPPPYKPHGVKMLYNGQPVDLTPEQEEVTSINCLLCYFTTSVSY